MINRNEDQAKINAEFEWLLKSCGDSAIGLFVNDGGKFTETIHRPLWDYLAAELNAGADKRVRAERRRLERQAQLLSDSVEKHENASKYLRAIAIAIEEYAAMMGQNEPVGKDISRDGPEWVAWSSGGAGETEEVTDHKSQSSLVSCATRN